MNHNFLMSAALVAVAAGALLATVSVAAQTPKEMIFGNKFTVTTKFAQSDGVGKNGEAFVLVEDNTSAADDVPGHRMHCLGVMQGIADAMNEEHVYCVETDLDGDQALWKVTPEAHRPKGEPIPAVHETVMGTGKYAGISMTLKSMCQVTSSGPTGYSLNCGPVQ